MLKNYKTKQHCQGFQARGIQLSIRAALETGHCQAAIAMWLSKGTQVHSLGGDHHFSFSSLPILS